MEIIVFADVVVEDAAIVLRHIQGAMPHQLLEHKGISATVKKILTGEGMAELVNRCAFDSPTFVIPSDCVAQSIFGQHTAIDITEKIILRFAATDFHIFPEDVCHKAAQGNDLNLSVLVMSEGYLHGVKVHILILNIADCGCTATAVQKKVHNDPATKLAKVTALVGALE